MATIKVKLSNQYVTSGVAGSIVPETWVPISGLLPQAKAYSPDYGKGFGIMMPFGDKGYYTAFSVCFNYNEIAGISKDHYQDYIMWAAGLSDPIATPGCSTGTNSAIGNRLGKSAVDNTKNLYMASAVKSAERLNSLIASQGDDFTWDFDYQLALSPMFKQTVPGSTFPSAKARQWMNSSDIQGSAAPQAMETYVGDGNGKTGPSMITSFQVDGNVGLTTPLSAAGAYNYNKYSGSDMTAFWSVNFHSHAVASLNDEAAAKAWIDDNITGKENCWDDQGGNYEEQTIEYQICCGDVGRALPNSIYIPENQATGSLMYWSVPPSVYYTGNPTLGTGFEALCTTPINTCYNAVPEPVEEDPTTDWELYATFSNDNCVDETGLCNGTEIEGTAYCDNHLYHICEGCDWSGDTDIVLPQACDTETPSIIQVKDTLTGETCCFYYDFITPNACTDLTNLELLTAQEQGPGDPCALSPCA
jgi:hypothetical protein